MMVAPAVYLVATPVAFVKGWLAVGLVVMIPIGRFIVHRRIDSKGCRSAGAALPGVQQIPLQLTDRASCCGGFMP